MLFSAVSKRVASAASLMLEVSASTKIALRLRLMYFNPMKNNASNSPSPV